MRRGSAASTCADLGEVEFPGAARAAAAREPDLPVPLQRRTPARGVGGYVEAEHGALEFWASGLCEGFPSGQLGWQELCAEQVVLKKGSQAEEEGVVVTWRPSCAHRHHPGAHQ